MSEIADVRCREVVDSRGNPAVEAGARVASGTVGRAAVPSTGAREPIEDAIGEDDWDGRLFLTQCLRQCTQIGGFDLFVTNTQILRQGIDNGITNAIPIRLNQIGMVSERIAAIELAHGSDYAAVVFHRSAEMEDVSIADMAVGTKADQIKTGSVSSSDRIAQYSRLLGIEEELQEQSQHADRTAFAARATAS
jgi:enolase